MDDKNSTPLQQQQQTPSPANVPAPSLGPDTPQGISTPETVLQTPQEVPNLNKSKRSLVPILLAAVVVISIFGGAGYLVSKRLSSNSSKVPTTGDSKITDSNSKKSPDDLGSFASGSNANDEAGITAISNARSIRASLESYYANNEYYPAELNLKYFTGASPAMLQNPDGTTISYSPSPEGCTTANKDCTSYTVVAKRTSGEILETLKPL